MTEEYLQPRGDVAENVENIGATRSPGRTRAKARVGPLVFADEYANPEVSVNQNRRTVEHNLVTSGQDDEQYLVQDLGSEPPTISISGIVREAQVDFADVLAGKVYVRTERWTGTAMVSSATTEPQRAVDGTDWLYSVTIELLGIERERGVEASNENSETANNYSPYR